MEAILSIVLTPTVSLMVPCLPRTSQQNTTILEIAPSGSTMPELRHKKSSIKIVQSTEVSGDQAGQYQCSGSAVTNHYISLPFPMYDLA